MSDKKKDRKVSYASISISIRGLEKNDVSEKDDELKPEKELDTVANFESIAQRYVTVLQMLWKYMHEIGAVAEQTSITNLASLPVLLNEIRERQKLVKGEEQPFAELNLKAEGLDQEGKSHVKEITLPIYEYKHLEKIQEYQKYHDVAFRILHETALQHLVNSWEKVLGDILFWYLKNNPDSAPKDKVLTFAEILQLNSLEEAQKKVIDKEVEEFLKNKDIDQQLRYLKDELKADLSSHVHVLSDLKESILRRHAIVHAGGVVTGEYLRRVKKIKSLSIEMPKEGEMLPLKATYVKNAWLNFFGCGVILLHLVAKNYSRSIKSKEDEDRADSFLLNAAFSNIENFQYESANIILEYAFKHRLVKDTSNLIVKINLAQTLKWQGNEKACKEILDEQDWSACNTTFQLCEAALREDIEKFKKLLSTVALEKKISITEVYDWPVFKKMREVPEFDSWTETAFSCRRGYWGRT